MQGFQEKPRGDGGWINGGFFVLSPRVIERIAGDATSWEQEPLMGLAGDGELAALRTPRLLAAHGHAAREEPAGRPVAERPGRRGKKWVNEAVWRDQPVFLTGHTGFKGSWLALWLAGLGARVHGYALDPQAGVNLFEAAGVGQRLAADTRADLADLGTLRQALQAARPRVVFHLAAQALVRPSYADPGSATFATNVMGTAHLLEAVRGVDSVQAVVVVTTDKCLRQPRVGPPLPRGAMRSAATTPTAPARARPRSSRPASAPASSACRRGTLRAWRRHARAT